MTLINLSTKNKGKGLGVFFSVAVVVFIACVLLFLFHYNRMVALQFDIRESERHIEALTLANAEYKAALNQSMAPEALDEIRETLGLVREQNPEYYTGVVEIAANIGAGG